MIEQKDFPSKIWLSDEIIAERSDGPLHFLEYYLSKDDDAIGYLSLGSPRKFNLTDKTKIEHSLTVMPVRFVWLDEKYRRSGLYTKLLTVLSKPASTHKTYFMSSPVLIEARVRQQSANALLFWKALEIKGLAKSFKKAGTKRSGTYYIFLPPNKELLETEMLSFFQFKSSHKK